MSTESIALPGRGLASRPLVDALHEWVTTVDHKRLGILYIVYALVFLVIGGIEADDHAHSADSAAQRFCFAAGLQPHVHHARDHDDFLRGDAHGVRIRQLPGSPDDRRARHGISAAECLQFLDDRFRWLLLYFSLVGANGLYGAGNAPDVGWFAYAPLTSRTFSMGHSTDFWTLSLLVSGFGSIGTAINILTTILCMRCPGMTLDKMPLLAWLNLVMAGMVLLAVSPLTAAQIMLLVDRYLGGHFFDTQAGGSAVIWMHFFWIFGHPEVYVLVIPAFAFVSEIIPVFSRKAIFGYPVMVAATVGIGFISMSVWAHHMFTVGMSAGANTFFVLSTMAIAVPTGIKIFNWLATMWGGKIQFKTPMLFCVGFLFQFLIAGLTGIMLSAAPFDWQLGNSYFVVAHFHYVIVGGILFTIFARFLLLVPEDVGKMCNETLGKLHFWLFLIGFHLTFDFMHIPGLLGMPRRIYTYEPGRGWDVWNLIVTIGVFFQALGILVFVANLLWSYFRGRRRGKRSLGRLDAGMVHQFTAACYNFASIPVVRSRRPLWDLKHPDDPDWKYE